MLQSIINKYDINFNKWRQDFNYNNPDDLNKKVINGYILYCIKYYKDKYNDICNKPSARWSATYLEGNRRDYSMLCNQTSGKGGGVQGVLTVVCMYVCLILYMSDWKRETQACRLVAGQVPIYILRPTIRIQLYFAKSFGAFLRTSALSLGLRRPPMPSGTSFNTTKSHLTVFLIP